MIPIIAFLAGCAFLIIAEWKYRVLTCPCDNNKWVTRGAALLSVLMCAGVVMLYAVDLSGERDKESITYPLEVPVSTCSPYVQQFDAFMKGQTEIDCDVDPRLAELENVYDFKQRAESGAPYLWDRAYYEGKFYSYFGIAPVLTVYFPYYSVTGALPSDYFVMFVFLCLCAVFMPLCLWAWAGCFAKKTPVFLLLFGAPAVFMGSLSLLFARGRMPYYYIASVAGGAFISAFFFFCLVAYGARKRWCRLTLWSLAGVSYGLLLQSRLNMALVAAFLIVPGLWFFIIGRERKEEEKEVKKEKTKAQTRVILMELAALGTPVLIFLSGCMIFNSIRFSGPFDFGTAYQLTITDTSKYELRFEELPYALWHYVSIKPKESLSYPYITLNNNRFYEYGRYVYQDATIGLLSVPINYAMFLFPAVSFSGKFTDRRRCMLFCSVVGVIATSLVNFCYGGVIFRYTGDMTFVSALISGIVLLSIYGFVANSNKKYIKYIPYVLIAFIFVYSFGESLRICLINDNNNLVAYGRDTAERLIKYLPFMPRG